MGFVKITSWYWNIFRIYWPFVWGIHMSQVGSPHKGPVEQMFSLTLSWTSSWTLTPPSSWWFETPWRHSVIGLIWLQVVCPQCGRTFSRMCHLYSHTREVHLQQRHHQCPVCGRQFGRRSNMKAHILGVHKMPYLSDGLQQWNLTDVAPSTGPCLIYDTLTTIRQQMAIITGTVKPVPAKFVNSLVTRLKMYPKNNLSTAQIAYSGGPPKTRQFFRSHPPADS